MALQSFSDTEVTLERNDLRRNQATYLNNSRKSLAFVISNKKFTWFHSFSWTSAFSTAQIPSTNHVGANMFTGPISIRYTLFSCKHIHRQILQSFWYLSIVWIKNKSILGLVLTVIYKSREIKWVELSWNCEF